MQNVAEQKMHSLKVWRERLPWVSLGLLLSLLLHALVLAGMLALKPPVRPPISQKVPVRLEFKEKAKAEPKRDKDRAEDESQRPDRSIVEAPLPETEAPDEPAYLGAQDHKAVREQKTAPRSGGAPAAPATALQNGPLRIETAPPDLGGRITVPRKQNEQKYASLLPGHVDVVNEGYNDYLPDKNIPVGPVLDVNTTDYRFIAYFTAVRKLVELAYYDIGPTLRDTPHVRGQMEEVGKVRFQGVSVVQLKVMRSGVLVESKLTRSSGDKDIDEFWVRILNLAAPYPPLPRSYPDEELVFTYSLYYDLVFQDEKKTRRFVF
jgi:hypothetical protein